MSKAKGHVLNLLGGLVLSSARVHAIDAPEPAFRVLTLDLDGAKAAQPGDKIQILLPDRSVRTYTPIGWGDQTRVVVYRHDPQTPAGRWIDALQVGDTLRFVGPQRSLRLAEGPVTLLGDETSIGVAASYALARPGQVTARFELGVEAANTLASVGLADAVTDGKLTEGVTGTVGITGGGALIQRARAELRTAGVKDIRVKAYWVAGKSGLD